MFYMNITNVKRKFVRVVKTHDTKVSTTIWVLKTLEAIGNCQRLVFTVGVSQHTHKITNM